MSVEVITDEVPLKVRENTVGWRDSILGEFRHENAVLEVLLEVLLEILEETLLEAFIAVIFTRWQGCVDE